MSDPAAEIGTDEDVRLVDEAVRRALVIPKLQAAAAALGAELLGYPVPMIGKFGGLVQQEDSAL